MDISIIIPVYQEDNINQLIDSIITNETSITYEIIVVDGDDGSTTEKISHENIITINSVKGRSYQMNAGFKKAKGEILLFLHADTFLPNQALEKIVQSLEKPSKYSAGAFDLSFDSSNKIINKIGEIASWRSRKLLMPYGDQAIFVKREVFEQIGGYKEIDLMEDINFIQKLKRKKYKLTILEDKILTSPRRWENKGAILNTVRNLILQLLYYMGVDPNKLAKFYK